MDDQYIDAPITFTFYQEKVEPLFCYYYNFQGGPDTIRCQMYNSMKLYELDFIDISFLRINIDNELLDGEKLVYLNRELTTTNI